MSYAGVDVGWAEWVAWTLEAEGHEVLIQAWDFGPGSHFVGEMHRALAGGRRTVAVLSAAYLESAFATEEWQAVWATDPAGTRYLLLVVRVEDCEQPGLLRQVVSVDLFDVNREIARQRLLNAIEPRRRKPDTEPEFPSAGQGAVAPSLPPKNRAMAVSMARSAYLEQVRQIAPPRLVGREAELARLAAFCTAPDDATARPYAWWRAAAWTGKSALMSSFALNPPPGVRVVSFFITARYSGNSDRSAFVEIIIEQLGEFLGRAVPPFQDQGRMERLWFQWFADAAAKCKARGERLVLVVDGLDEDRGVTGPGARSIAGLLPASPPEGARVVVAGRPDPPIPDDVPPGHPLRDPGITEILGRSEHAAAIRADMQADLHRLRTGSPLERDLLGLMTAAGGGLSGRDLEELSSDPGITEWDIERLLSTVAGRSFASRAPRWNPTDGLQVYLLGHEELQQEAVRAYGPTKLAAFRDRLHTWAQTYRQKKWPSHTPEYLLRGYYRLLLATNELTRAVDCATDQARHDRMLDLTGGDTAALAEITDAQNTILAASPPDLPLMARLAVHRQTITDRNSNMPAGLPAVWVRLGHATRAEQLASAITDPDQRARALVAVAGALVQMGELARAEEVAVVAEQVARTITYPDPRARALADVARALAQAGAYAGAEQVARTIAAPEWQARALADVAEARPQDWQPVYEEAIAAEQAARAITDPEHRARALADVARTLAQIGELADAEQAAIAAERAAIAAERAARTITHPERRDRVGAEVAEALAQVWEPVYKRPKKAIIAEQAAPTITDPGQRARALADVARTLAQIGELADAEQAATAAEQAARTITDSEWQAPTLAKVAGAFAQAGAHDHAEKIARTIGSPEWQARALAEVAGAFAQAGAYAHAEKVVRAIVYSEWEARELAMAAVAQAQAGQLANAEKAAAGQVAHAITDPDHRARALANVARTLVQIGELADAEQAATAAEQAARTITHPEWQARALADMARTLARNGELADAEQVAAAAEQLASAITDPDQRARALVAVAGALVQMGELARAEEVAVVAEQVARTITYPDPRARALADVARALAQAGVYAGAEQVARTIADPEWQARALADVARALAQAGVYAGAERAARTIADPEWQARALADVARALAQAGVYAGAERAARTITDPEWQARALADVARALAQAGQFADAEQAATAAEQAARTITHPEWQARALAEVAGAFARVEARDHAEKVAAAAVQAARTITHPDMQARALADVARTLARDGELADAEQVAAAAEQIARTITDPVWRAQALVEVAGALLKAGAHADAEQVAAAAEQAARTITHPDTEAHVLANVARTFAQIGAHVRAGQIASIISDPHVQAEVLAELARTLAETGHPTLAHSTLGAAFAVGDWRSLPLSAVVNVSPEAVRTIAHAAAGT
ncbi:TIR domain-containing protein [Frankia gtarii]|uniref:TIR domain-containing protein n=1 Tax=Frankia gtarii TaxID=2950102 RepID=UPI0021BF9637|nr:TIR domain-containing protein [Frankia gtarii]